jgi:hypothetical protein
MQLNVGFALDPLLRNRAGGNEGEDASSCVRLRISLPALILKIDCAVRS